MEFDSFRPSDVDPNKLNEILEKLSLQPILKKYGHVMVLNHKGEPQPLNQAVQDCKPLIHVLVNAESPEKLKQIIDSQKAPE